jgi:hypothetical protein
MSLKKHREGFKVNRKGVKNKSLSVSPVMADVATQPRVEYY